MKKTLLQSVCLCLCLMAQAFGQSSNARVSGTVNDATGAVLPGVECNGHEQCDGSRYNGITNEAGAYNFASLCPVGTPLAPRFLRFNLRLYRDVQLGNAAQVRLNFTLQVGAALDSRRGQCRGESDSAGVEFVGRQRPGTARSWICRWSATEFSIW